MGKMNELATCFYGHGLAIGADGRLKLLTPGRTDVTGSQGEEV